jgi:hypothetical protein
LAHSRTCWGAIRQATSSRATNGFTRSTGIWSCSTNTISARGATAKELEGEDTAVAKKEASQEYAPALEVVNEDLGVLSESEAEFLPITTRAYLYLSGTPFKALATGEFIEEQIFNWTYTDEQRAKAEFAEKHPDKRNPYGALPQMRL